MFTQAAFRTCVFLFKHSFCQFQCFDWAECLLLTLHTLKMAIFNYAKSFFWNTGLAKPFSWMWTLKLQYLNTDSPDRYPYLSFKNKLKESNKRSKHLIAFGDHFINSHNIPLDDVLTLFKENRCWSILGIKGFWTQCIVMNSKHYCCKQQSGFTNMSYLVYFTPKNISHSYIKNVEQYLNFYQPIAFSKLWESQDDSQKKPATSRLLTAVNHEPDRSQQKLHVAEHFFY